MHLAANTTYRVMAESGGDTALSVRPLPIRWHFVPKRVKQLTITSSMDRNRRRSSLSIGNSRAPLRCLPRWAYGFWQCRERYASQQQILDTAAEFRKRKIPVDVLVQDWQYWGKYGWNAMRFDESEYPDPAEMMSALHQSESPSDHLGLGKVRSRDSRGSRNGECPSCSYERSASTGEPGETKETENWADLFNPKAQKAFWSDIDRNLFASGLDGWWLDASEPEGDPLKNDRDLPRTRKDRAQCIPAV